MLKKLLNNTKNVAANILFPPNVMCLCCGDELNGSHKQPSICDACQIEYNKDFCYRCGRPQKNMAEFCDRCIAHGTYNFEKARSSVCYNDTAKKLIYQFKYGEAKYLAPHLANYMFECALSGDTLTYGIDLIIPVPLHKKRLRERGYNQSELLAKEFSKLSNIPYKLALKKTIHTKNLAKLKRQERASIIKNSFEVVEDTDLKNKSVLLIDDVLTTTATADECARILKKAGAATIKTLTFTSVGVEQKDR